MRFMSTSAGFVDIWVGAATPEWSCGTAARAHLGLACWTGWRLNICIDGAHPGPRLACAALAMPAASPLCIARLPASPRAAESPRRRRPLRRCARPVTRTWRAAQIGAGCHAPEPSRHTHRAEASSSIVAHTTRASVHGAQEGGGQQRTLGPRNLACGGDCAQGARLRRCQMNRTATHHALGRRDTLACACYVGSEQSRGAADCLRWILNLLLHLVEMVGTGHVRDGTHVSPTCSTNVVCGHSGR